MNVYTSNILAATVAFPFIAALVAVPYLVYQYRKFGSVPWLRTLVVYSFVFYLLCAYFLVLLPLPADRTAFVPYAATPQLAPFNFVREIVETTALSADPASWLGFVRTPAVYEAFFNLLLTVPFGMYLRYYFRRPWWQVLVLGFCLTLSFETLQLTGLLGIYEHPYRLFDVDDLIVNTLGAMVGFWLVGPALRVLPDMRLVNAEAREAGVHASVTRRALSFGIDLVLAQLGAGVVSLLVGPAAVLGASLLQSDVAWDAASQATETLSLALFFVAVPTLTRGQTLGQKLLRLRIVRPYARQAGWYQYAGRYGLLFLFAWAPFAALFGLTGLDPSTASEAGALAAFAASHQQALAWAWLAFMGAWAVTLAVRALRSALLKRPFVMLNGLLSNTRVMTCAAVERERERRHVLDVAEVAALERTLAEAGTPPSELMARAGAAVAEAVRTWVPAPLPRRRAGGSGQQRRRWLGGRPPAGAGGLPGDARDARSGREAARGARTHHGPGRVRRGRGAQAAAARAGGARRRRAVRRGRRRAGRGGRDAGHRLFGGRGARAVRGLDRGCKPSAVRRGAPKRARTAPQAPARAGRPRARRSPRTAPQGEGRPLRGCRRRAERPLRPDRRRSAPRFAADVTVTMLAFKPGLVVPAAARWTGAVRLAKLEGPEALEA